jgi:isoquinoline 1-oxidoreductase alpha subunit
MAFAITVNGTKRQVDVDDDTPLALGAPRQSRPDRHQIRLRRRDVRRLHGAYEWAAAALLHHPDFGRDGRDTTIEAIDGAEAKAVQDAWVALDVPQCGYCQSGQVMSASPCCAKCPSRPIATSISR